MLNAYIYIYILYILHFHLISYDVLRFGGASDWQDSPGTRVNVLCTFRLSVGGNELESVGLQ